MKAFDLELVNGRLVTSAGIHQADVGIREARIAAIGAWGTLSDAEEVIDGKVSGKRGDGEFCVPDAASPAGS